jgi:restriction system protein
MRAVVVSSLCPSNSCADSATDRPRVLSVRAKNSLGSTLTLFLVPPEVAVEIEKALSGTPIKPAEEDEGEAIDDAALKQNTEEQALEFTKDRLNKLDWSEMQDVVAGILRAMGYKTRISPSGPDQGKDIVASPDGLGFEQPRIVVEVKHRSAAMGSKEIRSFLGGRHKDDRGLYVSTGGFTKDAYYEAERAGIPLALMDLDDLVKALVENYEALDVETKRLIPLKRIYWPA